MIGLGPLHVTFEVDVFELSVVLEAQHVLDQPSVVSFADLVANHLPEVGAIGLVPRIDSVKKTH